MQEILNGFALDKKHPLSVVPYQRLDQLAHVPDEYTPPPPVEHKPRADPSSWLTDEAHRDQFVVRYSMPGPGGLPVHETLVNWCERMAPPQLCYGGMYYAYALAVT